MSGQLIVGVNPSNVVQNCEVTAAGHLKMDIASSGGGALSANVDVTGNSIGLATSANQSTGNASLATIAGDTTSLDSKVTACNTGAVAIASNSDTTKATSTLQTAGNASLTTIAGDTTSLDAKVVVCNTAGVIVTGSALPSGAATEATLSAAEAHLGTIDTSTATASTTLTGISSKLPAALGQDIMSDSLSVVIASNQSAVPVSSAGANVIASSESATPGAGVTTNSTAADMNGFQHVAIFGSTTNTTGDQFEVQFSNDNSTFYTQQNLFVSIQTSTGSFGINIDNVAARYVRVSQANTTGGSRALTIITSKK